MKKKELLKLLVPLFIYFIFVLLYYLCQHNGIYNYKSFKYFLCILGFGVYVGIILLNYKITKKILTPFTITFTFLFLFNYGQCILWIFNIHPANSIGTTPILNYAYPSDIDIVKTQLVSLTSILLYGLTTLFYNEHCKVPKCSDLDVKSIRIVSIVLGIISTICTFIILLNEIKISQVYGYNALYYGENMYHGSVIITIMSRFFLPCLFGIYLTNIDSKKNIYGVYFIFLVYIICSLLTGDRGNWVYALCFFVWLHHTFIKKINFKKAVMLILFAIFFLQFLYAIVYIRDSGISFKKIINALSITNNPIIIFINELGGSMKIQLYLLMSNYKIYPYGNSYFLGAIGMFSDRMVKLFISDYIILEEWFSQTHLNLNYGVGFSIVGEAILNYGPYFAPLVVMLMGLIINSIVNNKKVLFSKNVKNILFCLCFSISFITMYRGSFAYSIKMFLYKTVFYFTIIKITKILLLNYYKH